MVCAPRVSQLLKRKTMEKFLFEGVFKRTKILAKWSSQKNHHHRGDMAFFYCDICYFMKIDIHVLLSNIILHLARKNVEVALRIVKLYFLLWYLLFHENWLVIYIFLEVQGSHRGTIFLGQSLHIYFSHKGQRQNNFAILFVLQSVLPYLCLAMIIKCLRFASRSRRGLSQTNFFIIFKMFLINSASAIRI